VWVWVWEWEWVWVYDEDTGGDDADAAVNGRARRENCGMTLGWNVEVWCAPLPPPPPAAAARARALRVARMCATVSSSASYRCRPPARAPAPTLRASRPGARYRPEDVALAAVPGRCEKRDAPSPVPVPAPAPAPATACWLPPRVEGRAAMVKLARRDACWRMAWAWEACMAPAVPGRQSSAVVGKGYCCCCCCGCCCCADCRAGLAAAIPPPPLPPRPAAAMALSTAAMRSRNMAEEGGPPAPGAVVPLAAAAAGLAGAPVDGRASRPVVFFLRVPPEAVDLVGAAGYSSTCAKGRAALPVQDHNIVSLRTDNTACTTHSNKTNKTWALCVHDIARKGG